MHHFKIFTLLLFISFSTTATGQSLDVDYQVLKSQAPIPESILTTAVYKTEQEQEQKQEEVEQPNRKERRSKKDQIIYQIETNYVLDQLLKSNLLLFNTPLNELVENTALFLVQRNDLTLPNLSFYIIKSSSVNAFATDRGDIFITMGLLARLKNEAELAFVLSHELIHHIEKHSMNTYLQYENMENSRKKSSRSSIDVLLQKSNYSKALELEADEGGLHLFLNAGYSSQGIFNAFDILQYAHTSVFNEPIDRAVFELEYIKIDKNLWLENPEQRLVLEADSSIYSSHPDIKSRIELLRDELVEIEDRGEELFLTISKQQLDSFVLRANFELVQILLEEKNYTACLYQAFCLQKQYPDNVFLQNTFTLAMYYLGEYALIDKSPKLPRQTIQGQWQKVDYLFNHLTKTQIALLTAAYCWESSLKNPDNDQLTLAARDLIEDVVIFEIESPFDYFIETAADSTLDTIPSLRLAFLPYLKDATFTDYLRNGGKYRARKLELENRTPREIKKEEREERINGVALDVEKVVFVSPRYLEGTIGQKSTELNFSASETKQAELTDYIHQSADQLNLDAPILSLDNNMSTSDIATLNDMHAIQHWIDDFLSHPSYMISSNHNEVIAISDKYATDHFAQLGVLAFHIKENRGRDLVDLIFASRGIGALILISPMALPGLFYYTLRKRNELLYFMNVYNIREYKLEMDDFNQIGLPESPQVIKSNLYWSMSQIKQKEK